jgi:hypothetical protein
MEVSEVELQKAVEHNFGVAATLRDIVPVTETLEGRTAWDGVVYVFDLAHPEASTAYAWTCAVEGSTKRRFYTVLGKPPINSAWDAVRAAIVAEHRDTKE